ncbi:hypothetical protein ABZ569_29035 [Streptomyces albus]
MFPGPWPVPTVDPAEHHQVGSAHLGDPHIEEFLSFVRARQDG